MLVDEAERGLIKAVKRYRGKPKGWVLKSCSSRAWLQGVAYRVEPTEWNPQGGACKVDPIA
jgi:hypothetical protein